ncbi:MAG: hypothetical protein ACSLFB_04705 [Acidimicrobiales bacterium]
MRKLTKLTYCAAVILIVYSLLSGCSENAVRLSYRPEVGTKSSYRITVQTETTVQMEGEEPHRESSEAVLTTHHTVLGPDATTTHPTTPDPTTPDGVQVQVVVEEKGQADRTFIVRFDRSGQPVTVESEASSATDSVASTTLGLPEIFPAALSAPPDRSLRSGDQWTIDRVITLPGSIKPAFLVGSGRLIEFGIVNNERIARVSAAATLQLQNTRPASQGLIPLGEVRLDGHQTTNYRATHNLDDGTIYSTSSTTTGSYKLLVFPPTTIGGNPATGTMKVIIRSDAQQTL